jgi:hypothetical protein
MRHFLFQLEASISGRRFGGLPALAAVTPES